MELCVKLPLEAEQDPVAASVVASVGRVLPDTAAAQLVEMREHSASIDSMHEAIARVIKVKAKFYWGKFDPTRTKSTMIVGGGAGGPPTTGPLSVAEVDVEMESSSMLDRFKPTFTLEPVKNGIGKADFQVCRGVDASRVLLAKHRPMPVTFYNTHWQSFPTGRFADLKAASVGMMALVELWDEEVAESDKKVTRFSAFLRNFRAVSAMTARALETVQDALSRQETIVAKLAAANALIADAVALGCDFQVGADPTFGPLCAGHVALLQTWVPGSGGPWTEVYRATRDGFGAAAFHAKCDSKTRLLVLVQEKATGCLFGGFTAVGFIPGGARYITDPGAFVFSLTNARGIPEKLARTGTSAKDVYYRSDYAATFGSGHDLYVCDNANAATNSYANCNGGTFAAPSSDGTHPMAKGKVPGWLVAEVVAWCVPA